MFIAQVIDTYCVFYRVNTDVNYFVVGAPYKQVRVVSHTQLSVP